MLKQLRITVLAAACAVSGHVLAADNSNTSGAAQGTNVTPSTAIQKEKMEGDKTKAGTETGAPAAAGYPGKEGAPGSKSGQSVK
jgi:hypothetical protein